MDASETKYVSPVVLKRSASWDGIRIEHFRFREGELPEHSHRAHLITFALGAGCNGEIRTASGFQARAETASSVCVIPSGLPFTARLRGDSEQLAIYLDPAVVLRAADDARTPRRAFEVIEATSPNDPVVRNVGLALLGELESEGVGGRLYAESLANVLAIHLLRNYAASGAARSSFTGGLSGQRLRRVFSFIADNYESDLSLAELAAVAGVSAFHFAREFKRATGTTPHQYLMKFRVERAKAGSRSGFSHQSHFTRLFHKLTGMTPQSYRLTFQP